MIPNAPTRWYALGPYRILQHPLATNPAWSSYWIYRGDRLLGKLVSVPNLADCEHVERWGEHYDAQPHEEKPRRLRGAALLKVLSTA